MRLTFAPTHAHIAPFATTYYLFEDDQPLIDDSQRADCGHLRLFLNGNGRQNLPNGERIETTPAMLMGPHNRSSRFNVRGPLRFAGVSLRPRAWGGLFALDANTILNGGCDGAPFLSPLTGTVIERLKRCAVVDDMAPILDAFLMEHIRPIPPEHIAVIEEIRLWLKSTLFPDVEVLYAACALSDRQVTRIANRYWGSPPKGLARKYGALRTASHILENDGAIPAEATAHYADRSHLIREVRAVTGMTPRQLHTITNMIMRITLSEGNFRELLPLS
jgi:AraC-like DNA-binding protein